MTKQEHDEMLAAMSGLVDDTNLPPVIDATVNVGLQQILASGMRPAVQCASCGNMFMDRINEDDATKYQCECGARVEIGENA